MDIDPYKKYNNITTGKEKNMAKKNATVYVCNNCGYESSKWLGKCPACNEWNSFFEEKVQIKSSTKEKVTQTSKPVKLNEVDKKTSIHIRKYPPSRRA